MEQGGLPGTLLLAPFQEFVQEVAANSFETQSLLHWLLKEDCPQRVSSQLRIYRPGTLRRLYIRGASLLDVSGHACPHLNNDEQSLCEPRSFPKSYQE